MLDSILLYALLKIFRQVSFSPFWKWTKAAAIKIIPFSNLFSSPPDCFHIFSSTSWHFQNRSLLKRSRALRIASSLDKFSSFIISYLSNSAIAERPRRTIRSKTPRSETLTSNSMNRWAILTSLMTISPDFGMLLLASSNTAGALNGRNILFFRYRRYLSNINLENVDPL